MNPFQIPKKKPTYYKSDNIIEALRSIGSSIGQTVTKDVLGQIPKDALKSVTDQYFGEQNIPPNYQEHKKENDIPQQSIRPEFQHARNPIRLEEAGIKQKIESVRLELVNLAKAIKSLNQEIDKAVMDIPENPGIYHLNFLERLRAVIIALKQNVEDSRSWLAMQNNRKKKKGYWGMYKKHGTTFGLSQERTLATQAG